VERQASLELRGAVDLTCDEHAAVQQNGRLTPFHDGESLRFQRRTAERGQLPGRLVGHGETPPGPHQRVQRERESTSAAQPGQTGEVARVVEVPVAEDHRFEVTDVQAEPLDVSREPVGRHTGVEQEGVRGRRPPYGHQGGETVFGDDSGKRPALLELRGGNRGQAGERSAPRRTGIAHERVVAVVHEDGQDHLVDRLEVDGIDRGPARGPGRRGLDLCR
jgi:hypothetical protein